jgi:hypothetical protein
LRNRLEETFEDEKFFENKIGERARAVAKCAATGNDWRDGKQRYIVLDIRELFKLLRN